MCYFSDNPVADWDRYCGEEKRELARLPKCEICGESITDDVCYEIEGELICPDCLKDHYQKWTEDYIKEN